MSEDPDRRHHDRRTPDRRRDTLGVVPLRGFLAAALLLALLFIIVWSVLL
jgi:hypothetical protein